MKLVANAKTFVMLDQFTGEHPLVQERITVGEGGTLALGSHTLHFVLAPMVHWPEVMVAYEDSQKVLFSADGFGNFGSLTYTDAWADEARQLLLQYRRQIRRTGAGTAEKGRCAGIQTVCPCTARS